MEGHRSFYKRIRRTHSHAIICPQPQTTAVTNTLFPKTKISGTNQASAQPFVTSVLPVDLSRSRVWQHKVAVCDAYNELLAPATSATTRSCASNPSTCQQVDNNISKPLHISYYCFEGLKIIAQVLTDSTEASSNHRRSRTFRNGKSTSTKVIYDLDGNLTYPPDKSTKSAGL